MSFRQSRVVSFRSLNVVMLLVLMGAVVAACFAVIKQTNRIDKVEHRMRSASVEQLAISADRDPDNFHFALVSDDKLKRVEAVATGSNTVVITGGKSIPEISDGIYQMWVATDTQTVSVAILGSRATQAAVVRLPYDAKRVLITKEPKSGSSLVNLSQLVASADLPADYSD